MITHKHVSDTIKAEIHRLRPHYLSSTSTDQARRQMLDHFDAFADRLAAIQTDPETKPVAIRRCFDGQGWLYLDEGSGSDCLRRALEYPDARTLFNPQLPKED